MLLFGMTGPIGHGKSTFAKAVKKLEPSLVQLESSLVISEVANALHQRIEHIPKRDDLDSINNWLRELPQILKEVVHFDCEFERIEIKFENIEQHPIEYEKLLLHIENLNRNPGLAHQDITPENKEVYRPILQWLGGYLVKKVNPGIWYEEIVRRVKVAEEQGAKICIVGGLRYPNDARLLREAGAIIIKVYRPDHLQYDILDPTERERDDIIPDCTIVSDGTIEDMNRISRTVLDDIRADKMQKVYHTAQ